MSCLVTSINAAGDETFVEVADRNAAQATATASFANGHVGIRIWTLTLVAEPRITFMPPGES